MVERSPDRIYSAGDVIVDEIKLVSYSGFELDLRKIVGDFSIYEDLYSNTLSGSLVFPDSMNLVANTPIIGDEDLYITFYTPGVDYKPRRVRFKVFKISSFVRGTGTTTVAVRLEFVSHLAELFSLSKLKEFLPAAKYRSAPSGFRSDDGERMIEAELRNISSYAIRDMGDKLRETKLGMYASSMLVHETTTKSYYTSRFSYRDSFGDTPHMNKGRMIPYDSPVQDRYAAHLKYYDKSHFMFDGIDDTNYIDRSQNRQSLLNQMNAMTMTIDVYGDTMLRVGNMIEVEFFSQEYTKDKDDFLDPYLSGKYMITAIMHNVVEGIHTMRVTICRDSYSEPLPDKKAKFIS